MIKTVIFGVAVALAPLAASAQATLTAETTTPGSTPHYIDTTLAAILDSAGVATVQITEGATLTNSVQAVAEGRLDMAPAPLILPFLLSRGIGPYSGVGAEDGANMAGNCACCSGTLARLRFSRITTIIPSKTSARSMDCVSGTARLGARR